MRSEPLTRASHLRPQNNLHFHKETYKCSSFKCFFFPLSTRAVSLSPRWYISFLVLGLKQFIYSCSLSQIFFLAVACYLFFFDLSHFLLLSLSNIHLLLLYTHTHPQNETERPWQMERERGWEREREKERARAHARDRESKSESKSATECKSDSESKTRDCPSLKRIMQTLDPFLCF